MKKHVNPPIFSYCRMNTPWHEPAGCLTLTLVRGEVVVPMQWINSILMSANSNILRTDYSHWNSASIAWHTLKSKHFTFQESCPVLFTLVTLLILWWCEEPSFWELVILVSKFFGEPSNLSQASCNTFFCWESLTWLIIDGFHLIWWAKLAKSLSERYVASSTWRLVVDGFLTTVDS